MQCSHTNILNMHFRTYRPIERKLHEIVVCSQMQQKYLAKAFLQVSVLMSLVNLISNLAPIRKFLCYEAHAVHTLTYVGDLQIFAFLFMCTMHLSTSIFVTFRKFIKN